MIYTVYTLKPHDEEIHLLSISLLSRSYLMNSLSAEKDKILSDKIAGYLIEKDNIR